MGWIDSKLTENGKQQAFTLSKKLKNKKIDIIFASDLGRAKQTAEIISTNLGIPVIFDWLLRERHNGILQGKPNQNLNWPEYNIENIENANRNIEPISNIAKRANAFIDNLILLPISVNNILIVSHNGLINNLLSALNSNHKYRPINHTEIIEHKIKHPIHAQQIMPPNSKTKH
jgi:broad specificity phosphatase PhoE